MTVTAKVFALVKMIYCVRGSEDSSRRKGTKVRERMRKKTWKERGKMRIKHK